MGTDSHRALVEASFKAIITKPRLISLLCRTTCPTSSATVIFFYLFANSAASLSALSHLLNVRRCFARFPPFSLKPSLDCFTLCFNFSRRRPVSVVICAVTGFNMLCHSLNHVSRLFHHLAQALAPTVSMWRTFLKSWTRRASGGTIAQTIRFSSCPTAHLGATLSWPCRCSTRSLPSTAQRQRPLWCVESDWGYHYCCYCYSYWAVLDTLYGLHSNDAAVPSVGCVWCRCCVEAHWHSRTKCAAVASVGCLWCRCFFMRWGEREKEARYMEAAAAASVVDVRGGSFGAMLRSSHSNGTC